MIRVHFVGDGARDAATVPYLVENILGVKVESKPYNWKDIHLRSGTGYSKRLRFFVLRAIENSADGLVAVVDRDKSEARSRLRELQESRDDHRKVNPPFPTALGEAAPHGEAWLLDDPSAIRIALELDDDVAILTVTRTKNPKGALENIIQQSRYKGEKMATVFTSIARLVNPGRCVHGKETGFAALVEDVLREMGHLAANR